MILTKEFILDIMQNIEDEIKLESHNESDGRYTWPERWRVLKKRIDQLSVLRSKPII